MSPSPEICSLGWACELDWVHVALYVIFFFLPPSIRYHTFHHYMALTSLWHLAITLYDETSFSEVSYFFCHNTYAKYHQRLFFYKDIWSLSEEQVSFEISPHWGSINFTVDADGNMVFHLLVWKYVIKRNQHFLREPATKFTDYWNDSCLLMSFRSGLH